MADNLLDKASILLTPTAYNDGSMLSVKPENGDGDFTFSRSSAATRVNAQGLVENVQIISSELVSNGNFSQIGTEEVSNGNFSQEGSELVTNGDFATDSDWSKDTSWTIENGAANYDGLNSVNDLQQTNVLIGNSGTSYVIRFEVKSGTLRLLFAEGAIGLNSYANYGVGTHTIYVKKTTSSTELRIYAQNTDGGTSGSIDNVSVKEVGQDWTISSGWSIGDGKATTDGTINSNCYQDAVTTIGQTYKYSFDVLDSGSGVIDGRFRNGGGVIQNFSSEGTYTGTFVAYNTLADFTTLSGNTASFSITNISVKEVGQDWTFGTGWSVDQANSKVVGDGTMGANVFRQNVGFTQGNTYKFSFTIEDYVSGSIYIREPFNGYLDAASADGDYSFDYVAGMSDYIDFRGNSFVGSITNISVKEITDDTDLPRINYEGFSYQDSLGSEEIVNGDFATDSNWTKQTGWSIDTINGKAIAQNVPNLQRLQQNISGFTPVVGATYQYSFDISNVDGFYTVWAFGNSILNSVNTEGTITGTFEATSTNNGFYFAGATASGLVSATLDNVSVKEVLGQEVVPDSGCGSWLLEPQSTNLITYSSDLSSLNLRSNAVVTSNEVISPSGDLDADKITFDGTLYGRVEQTIAATVGQPYTISVYLKNKDLSDVTQVWIGFSQVSQGQFVTITDEWQRYDITTNADGSSEYPRIQFSGTGSLYAWGFQVEQQSYATSYIPTNGATNTRLQDIATNSGNSTLINSTEGVLYAEIAYLNDTGTYRTISINDGTNNNQVAIENRPISNQIKAFVVVGGVSVMNSTQTLTDVKSFNKMALKWKQNDFAWWVNGVQIYEDLSGSTFGSGVLNKLNFNNGIQNFPFEGKTKALVVYKEALTDAELQSLTTI